MRSLSPTWVLVATLALSCADVDDARGRWLQNTLVEDNLDIILREPTLSQGKFDKMEVTPYTFFRGTSPQFWRDMSEPAGVRTRTRFGSAETSDIWLVGDPHPENIGSYVPADTTLEADWMTPVDGALTIDFNDFDAARFGPYHFDLWRLALGFDIAARTIGASADSEQDRGRLVEAVAQGYWDEVEALRGGAVLRVSWRNGFGAIVDDLMRRADRDGRITEELDEYTVVVDGSRETFFGTVEESENPGVVRDEVTPVSDAERRMVDALVAQAVGHLETPQPDSAFAVKGVSRRLGAGVASYPLLRFYVLVEGPTAEIEDDYLIEVKEIRNTTPVDRLAIFPARRFANNAERAVMGQRELQVTRHNDPLLAWASFDGFSFRVRHRTKFQKGVDVGRIGENLDDGSWAFEDLLDYANLAGRLLARAHGQAAKSSGERGIDALAAALTAGPGRDAFVQEVSDFVQVYGPRLMNDYELYKELRDDHGPLLGARRGNREIR